ncbi:MAG TPA: LuxR C-terminal-related transcriptional regulator [Chitinophagales bacterium]|nr:LuxR C-terminal-related transcriptional regulator [Chitinophagales bacterium]
MTHPLPPVNIFSTQGVAYGELKNSLLVFLDAYKENIGTKTIAEVKLQIAFCYAITGNLAEAEKELKSCEEYILNYGMPEEKACVHHVRARIFLNQTKYEEGLAAGVQSLHMFRQLQFPFFTRITCMVCGHLCSHSNLFTEAMNYLAEAHTVALQMGDVRGAITSTANLNDIRIQVLPADECIWYNKELLKEIEQEYKEEPNPILAGTCLQLAHLYLKQNDTENAALFADKTASELNHLTHLPPHYFLYTNLYATKAEISALLNNEEDVIKYATECAERGRQAGKIVPETDANFILFRFYIKQNQLQKAKHYLDHAASILPESDKSFIYLQLLENKCLYYKATGNTTAELEQFKLMHEYKMKTHEQASRHRSNYLALAHDLELKKKQIEEQKTELSFKTQELNMTSYHLEQRNKLLTDLEQSITALKKTRPKTDVVFKTIEQTIERAFNKEEEEKNRFRQKFDETHREFIAGLHRAYPQLSPTECRVSALLRSGFNTKEIANLLSASQRTIETQRLSIRKKLGLTRDENLNLLLNSMSQ